MRSTPLTRRILIVSSDPDEAFLAATVLRAALDGSTIDEAGDAIAFARALERDVIDVAVVARRLAWCDGLDALRLIHRKYPRCVTVLLGETSPDITDPEIQPDCHLSAGTSGLARLGDVAQRALESAAARAARSAGTVENLPVAVLHLSADERVLDANAAAAALLGHDDARSLTGRPLTALLGTPGTPGDDTASPCIAASVDPGGLEVTALRHGAAPARCRLVVRVQQRDGALAGFVAALLPQSPAVAHDAEHLVFALSHDLRQPLHTTRQTARMLGDRLKASARLGTEEERMLRRIISGAERMDSLVGGLLEYVETGRSELAVSRFDLGEVVEEVVAGLDPASRDPGAVVRWNDLPEIEASRAEIARLVENLVSNALKFHQAQPPEVEVGCVDRGDCWLLSVRDNGIGIAPQDAERLFEPFQRLHAGSEYPGTGIGLAICRQISERHGGRIWLTPNPDRGTTFNVTIAKHLGDTTS